MVVVASRGGRERKKGVTPFEKNGAPGRGCPQGRKSVSPEFPVLVVVPDHSRIWRTAVVATRQVAAAIPASACVKPAHWSVVVDGYAAKGERGRTVRKPHINWMAHTTKYHSRRTHRTVATANAPHVQYHATASRVDGFKTSLISAPRLRPLPMSPARSP